MAGQDYGPKGCCGPEAYAALLAIIAGIAYGLWSLGAWLL